MTGRTSLKNVTFTGSDLPTGRGVTIRPGNTALTSAAIKCTGSTVLTAPTLTLSVSKKGQAHPEVERRQRRGGLSALVQL